MGKAPMGEMPIFSVPFQHVAIDIVGPFPRSQGYAYLLTYICLSSKYPECCAPTLDSYNFYYYFIFMFMYTSLLVS